MGIMDQDRSDRSPAPRESPIERQPRGGSSAVGTASGGRGTADCTAPLSMTGIPGRKSNRSARVAYKCAAARDKTVIGGAAWCGA